MCRLIAILAAALVGALGAAAAPPATGPATAPAALAPPVAAVLRYVPDDAHLVLVVPSLQEAVAGISAFGRAIGVKDMADVTVLEVLQGPLGERAKAIEAAGPFVMALSAQHGEPVLIGSCSAAGLPKSTTSPAELVPGVQLIEVGDSGYLALTADRVAIIGREKNDLLRALESSGKIARRFAEQYAGLLASRQAVLYIDVPPWHDVLRQQLGVVAQSMYMGMAATPNAAEGIQVWKWIFEQVERIAGELNTYVVTARVDGEAVFLEDRLEFKPEGTVARYLRAVRKPKRDLLRGLSPDPAAFVFAYEWELPPDVESVEAGLMRAFLRMDAMKERLGAEKLEAALDRSVEIHRKICGSNGVVEAVPEGDGLLISGLYLTTEGPVVQRELRELYETFPELMNAWGGLPSTTVRHEDEKLGDVVGDLYRFTFETDDARLQPMLQMVYGATPSVYIVAYAPGVAYALGAQEPARVRMLRLLSQPSASLSRDPRVATLFTKLSPNPQMCMLVDAPRCVKLFGGMVRRIGVPFPAVPLSDEPAALIGCALYLEPEAMHGELLIPAAPLKSLVEAFQKSETKTGKDD